MTVFGDLMHTHTSEWATDRYNVKAWVQLIHMNASIAKYSLRMPCTAYIVRPCWILHVVPSPPSPSEYSRWIRMNCFHMNLDARTSSDDRQRAVSKKRHITLHIQNSDEFPFCNWSKSVENSKVDIFLSYLQSCVFFFFFDIFFCFNQQRKFVPYGNESRQNTEENSKWTKGQNHHARHDWMNFVHVSEYKFILLLSNVKAFPFFLSLFLIFDIAPIHLRHICSCLGSMRASVKQFGRNEFDAMHRSFGYNFRIEGIRMRVYPRSAQYWTMEVNTSPLIESK